MGDGTQLDSDLINLAADEDFLISHLPFSVTLKLLSEKLKYNLFGTGELSSSPCKLQIYYKSKYARELD